MICQCCNESPPRYSLLAEDVHRCNYCQHIYRDYKGDSVKFHAENFRDVKKARRHIDEIDENGNITELFHQKRKDIVSRRVDFVKEILNSDFNCLDVGAGAGTFAKEVRRWVSSIECTELTPSLIKECKKLGFKTYEQDFLKFTSGKKYDIVFAWHVLEHVDDIKKFRDRLLEATNRYAVVEIPLLVALNGEGRRRNLKPPNNGNYDGHAHYFSETSFIELFKNQFNIIMLKEGVQSPALFAILEKK